MERQKHLDQTAALVWGVLFAACLLASGTFAADWAGLLAPAAGVAGTAFAWHLFARLALGRDEKFQAKHFRRALFDCMAVPVWLGIALGAAGLAGLRPADDAGFAMALFSLAVLVLMAAVPLTALVLGVLAIVHGARHLKESSEAQGRFYHEGPLVLASLLFVVDLAVLGVTMFYVSI